MNTEVLFSKNSDEWQTPPNLYNFLDNIFHFVLDPCANDNNTLKTERFYTKEQDGLNHYWGNASTFINPPYSQISKWIDRSIDEYAMRVEEYVREELDHIAPIVMLVPARTDTKWFHRVSEYVRIVFLKGRLKFVGAASSAPFPSCLVIFNGDDDFTTSSYHNPGLKSMSCFKLDIKNI